MAMCVCGSGLSSDQCCDRYLAGELAPTAEALMRSRYTAYVKGNIDHIVRTSAPEALEGFSRSDAERASEQSVWKGLDIKSVTGGGVNDDTGTVDFYFSYDFNNQPNIQREIAHFVKKDGAWLYRDSIIDPKEPPVRVEHIGRNDPCSCGSGKKYKKCCGG